MSKSKKGSAFEREVATMLSEWWSLGIERKARQDIFWRTAGSGARATTRRFKNQRTAGQYGDITAIDTVGEPLIKAVTIELKRGYSSHTIAGLLDKRKGSPKQKYEEFFSQTIQAHQNAGSFAWALITKRDRYDPMIFIPNFLWGTLNGLHGIQQNSAPQLSMLAVINDELYQIIGMKLSTFLFKYHPQHFIQLSKM